MDLQYSLYIVVLVLFCFFGLILIRLLLVYSQSNSIIFCSSFLIHCTLMMMGFYQMTPIVSMVSYISFIIWPPVALFFSLLSSARAIKLFVCVPCSLFLQATCKLVVNSIPQFFFLFFPPCLTGLVVYVNCVPLPFL